MLGFSLNFIRSLHYSLFWYRILNSHFFEAWISGFFFFILLPIDRFLIRFHLNQWALKMQSFSVEHGIVIIYNVVCFSYSLQKCCKLLLLMDDWSAESNGRRSTMTGTPAAAATPLSKIQRNSSSTLGGQKVREEKIRVTVRMRPLNRHEQAMYC